MRLYILLVIYCFFTTSANALITLDSQEDVDAFPIFYPSPTVTESLLITGQSITNLEGLSHVTTINGNLSINKTALTSLQGLQSLEFLDGSLTISGCFDLVNMSSIENLKNIEGSIIIQYTAIQTFPNLKLDEALISIFLFNNHDLIDISSLENLNFQEIKIHSNTNLSMCSYTSICALAQNPRALDINGNAEGCCDWNEILDNCEGYLSCENDESYFKSDFSNWGNGLTPKGWISKLDTILLDGDSTLTIQQHFGDEIGSSVSLTAFASGSGSFESRITKRIPNDFDSISISFNHCFIDPDIRDFIGRAGIIIDKQVIWLSPTIIGTLTIDCENFKRVKICNIPISSTEDSIDISFVNGSYSSPLDAINATSWVLNNIEIKKSVFVSNVAEPRPTVFSIFPNPVENIMSVNTQTGHFNYKIYNTNGSLISKGMSDERIDVSNITSGIYFLQITNKGKTQVLKFIKS